MTDATTGKAADRILAVMKEADRPLTQDEIAALVVLRDLVEQAEAMAQKILSGTMTARRRPGIDDSVLLSPDSFIYEERI